MVAESKLLLALEFVTEGAKAQVPSKFSREMFSTERFQMATETVKKKSRPWTQGPGIQGLGIGEKITDGKQHKSLALRVYVEKKKPNAKLKNKVPKEVNIPEVGKVPTDVLEIGKVELEVFRSKAHPAMPGCGLGHVAVTVGTFGCLVRKKSGGKGLYILSNSHVLANEGLATVGDAIIQPGDADGGRTPKDVLAKLEAFEPFIFSSTGYPNLVDAAIAKVSPSKVTKIIRLLGVAPAGVGRTLRRGMKVQKVGRTTDYTTGVISDVNYRFRLRYKKPGGGTGLAGFRDQVLCTRYTAGGDSGSAVLNSSKRVVGLHFAGSPSSSVFNRIEHVFDALGIELA